MPTVSIITPTYNRSPLLKEAIAGVLGQTFTNFEWIILDDGSEDDTEQVVKALNDERIVYHRLEHTGHLPSLRNKGISLSKGEYIAFLDSDDTWMPGMLAALVNMLGKNAALGFALGDARIVRGKRLLYAHIYSEVHKSRNSFYMPLFTDKLFVIFPSTLLVRKSCFEKTGIFNEQLKYGDKDLFTRLAYHFKGGISEEVLVMIRRHRENMSADLERGSLAELSFIEELHTLDNFLKNEYIDKEFHRKISAVFNFKLAEFYFMGKYFREAKEAYAKSLALKMGQPKAWVKYMISRMRT
jgi:glycosyltransferase involved in cell wall biosynthesis